MLIEKGILKSLVRQDNPTEDDLQKDLVKRIKKHMKKHYTDYVNLTPIRYDNNEFLFEIHDAYGHFVHYYKLVFDEPNYHYGKHMGMNVQWCHTPFELYNE